jgi:uncharacterized protein YyaL (SSP411 family)
VRGFWDSRRDDVRAQTAALADFLRNYDRSDAAATALDDTPLRSALAQIARAFDAEHGGHHGAPKFPHCPEMELLLDLGPASAGRDANLKMVELTLRRMADGGIHDQIGGGFCRYSVDERWEIPHFEKMLYDNAQLLPLYAMAAWQFDETGFARVARELLAWLVREMTAPTGGFYTALDADSEHEEGKFYVWQREELRGLLDADELALADAYYGFGRAPNFEHKAWNPVVATSLPLAAEALAIGLDAAAARLASIRQKLFTARGARVRPGLDDKILTANNALMIAGVARAARTFDAPSLLGLADNALDFLHRAAWRDGRLYAKSGSDAARFPAYLDDHAFLLDALLECLQSRWSSRDLEWAIALADALLERFEDREHGGFFFTAHDHETLPQRPKPWTDDAVPSGNGVAARALLRLGHLFGETRYLEAAERTLQAAHSTMQQMPHACASLLRALNDYLHPRTHVVIRYGSEFDQSAWRAALAESGAGRIDAYFIAQDATGLPATIAAQESMPRGAAYVCRGTNCLPPINDPSLLAASLA